MTPRNGLSATHAHDKQLSPLEQLPATANVTDGEDESDRPVYSLRILQDPKVVRCCGFGNKDRRSIDPPPVVELIAHSSATSQQIPTPLPSTPFLILHVSLWSADGLSDCSLLENPYLTWRDRDTVPSSRNPPDQRYTDSSIHNLVGNLVSMGHKFTDTNGHKRIMFAFPDVSVRCPGIYTLKFSLVDLGSRTLTLSTTLSTTPTPIIQTRCSSAFTAYKPKDFPGKFEPTPLSRALAKQGILEIHARSNLSKMAAAEKPTEDSLGEREKYAPTKDAQSRKPVDPRQYLVQRVSTGSSGSSGSGSSAATARSGSSGGGWLGADLRR